jgi:hypothetical protein
MYHAGSGVAKDMNEAVRLYRLAIDQGIADAMVNLGAIFIKGDGLPSDIAEGIRLYNLAAEQESSEAQMRLGNMYEHGVGFRQDTAEAVAWYTRAIQQGNPNAQFCLGFMLFSGRGVPKDVQKACELMQVCIQMFFIVSVHLTYVFMRQLQRAISWLLCASSLCCMQLAADVGHPHAAAFIHQIGKCSSHLC